MNTNPYEPKSVYDIVFGSPTAQKLIYDIAKGRRTVPYFGKCGILLHGPWGTGKTTLAKLLPEAIELATGKSQSCSFTTISCGQGANGPAVMQTISQQLSVISLNASGKHYFILDEVDNLTQAAQESLKSKMNTASAVFIMTTNHKDSIDPGVLNRSIEIDMKAAPAAAWLPFMRRILDDHDVQDVDDADLVQLIETCNGSCREIADCALSIVLA